MKISQLFPVIIGVLTDFRVIITAVVVFLYMDLCAYIVRYRKKPPVVKKRKTSSAPAPAPAAPAAESGDDNASEEGGE